MEDYVYGSLVVVTSWTHQHGHQHFGRLYETVSTLPSPTCCCHCYCAPYLEFGNINKQTNLRLPFLGDMSLDIVANLVILWDMDNTRNFWSQ
jgi:hypothetical protein